jgi:hypothetical protein
MNAAQTFPFSRTPALKGKCCSRWLLALAAAKAATAGHTARDTNRNKPQGEHYTTGQRRFKPMICSSLLMSHFESLAQTMQGFAVLHLTSWLAT